MALKGLLTVDIEITGSKSLVDPEAFSGFIAEPTIELVQLLSTLHNPDSSTNSKLGELRTRHYHDLMGSLQAPHGAKFLVLDCRLPN